MKKTIGIKLITYTKRLKLKIQSRVWNFKNTMLKKRRRQRRKGKQKKQSRTNYKENIGTQLITNTKKQKLKIQSRVWNFKNTMLKKEEEKERERKKNKQTRTNKVA